MGRGKFIVFEGLDASGKTTQAYNLVRRLNSLGGPSIYTREPTDSLPGGIVRSALRKKTQLGNESIALLFLADRLEHISDVILPALEEGYAVVSDRYCLSNIAYQGLEMDMRLLLKLNEMMVKLQPDITVFLDVAPEECNMRINRERLSRELYEETDKQTRIRENFFEIFDILKNKENILVLNSDENVEGMFEKIWSGVSLLFA